MADSTLDFLSNFKLILILTKKFFAFVILVKSRRLWRWCQHWHVSSHDKDIEGTTHCNDSKLFPVGSVATLAMAKHIINSYTSNIIFLIFYIFT